MDKKMMVRYCLAGHEVTYSGMCPSTCRTCGQRINLGMPPITFEEAEAARAAKEARTTSASVPKEPPQRENVPPVSEEAAQPVMRRPPVQVSRQPVTQSGRQPVGPTGRQSVMPAGRTAVSTGVRQPFAPSDSGPVSQTLAATGAGALSFNYFGTSISIPPEGGWLGREALGGDFFEGNRLISRRHVFVRPDRNGRLIVQDDHSLNGVFYHTGEGRRKLERSATVLLSPGDTLWLYNLPLILEVTDHV